MNRLDVIRRLSELDQRGVYVLAKRDIEKLFPDEDKKVLEKSLKRMVDEGFLVSGAKGIYVNPAAHSKSSRVVEDVARAPAGEPIVR